MEKQVALWDAFPIYGYERQSLIAKEKGCVTIPLQLELPEVFTLDASEYGILQEQFFNIIAVLGPDRLLHRQDFFLQENYNPIKERQQGDFLERANEHHFEDRPYLIGTHYLYISIVPKNYINYSSKRANSFLGKNRDFYLNQTVPTEFIDTDALAHFENQVANVNNLINATGLVKSKILEYEDLFSENGLYAKYFGLSERNTNLRDVDFSGNTVNIGRKQGRFFTLENLDQFTKDHIGSHELYGKFTTRHNRFPIGNLFSLGFKVPHEHIINQYIYVPNQEKVLAGLRKKAKNFQRFGSGRWDDSNTIYANQIYEYTKDVLESHRETVFYHLNVFGFEEEKDRQRQMENDIASAFKKLKINAKQNTIDRKNLFFAGVPGNGIGISSDMYMPMPSDMASALLYFEGGYKDSSEAVEGLRLVDRISGRPLSVSVYREPEKKDWIFNRGMLVASGSGGGKSYYVNHYIASELRQGGEAVIMEDGNSYDKLTEVFGGVILQHDDASPFTFNPFLLDKYDFIESSGKGKALTEGKLLHLVSLLKLITDNKNKGNGLEVTNTVLELLVSRYYETMWRNGDSNFKFDTFFAYCKEQAVILTRTKKIPKEKFDPHVFLFLLEKYGSEGPRGNLLNKVDDRITGLSEEKVVYFKLGKLIDNDLLFPITALMIMDIFNKKMHDPSKLSINKIIAVDEAWKALITPELESYFNGQSRMARKLGGQPIFISQKVSDFISSEIIKNAIVVNSHIKVFLDMRDFALSFDKIQAIMGLGEKQKQLILSINKDLPKGRKLREVAFCWMDKVKVYGVETSLEEKCIYETNPTESSRIEKLYRNNHNNWELTAKAYAYANSLQNQKT
ncbi:TraG family conjugative transposon ATPase [Allomuricauda sp. ARW1Y1]|jgi:conjugation system TraG family ATPase|uniref:TraG family conjugative transposon ATPase n=1 Tax=Allomuricauda sp. ARW1Y1 TaxID=2663843 RepID=UPI0015C8C563|nr:TraG family conjugative transposon ATPase [Muricauda sp. ARW1Y1]NYJ28200.1 conjugation system TraG family ATPase [Muricauda sp. ARW1Y1]